MFYDRPKVKDVQKIQEEAKAFNKLANQKMREYVEEIKKERDVALQEACDLSERDWFFKEISKIKMEEEELEKEFERKKREANGYVYIMDIKVARIRFSEEEIKEYGEKVKELESEYEIKFEELYRKKKKMYLQVKKKLEEKKRQKRELCEIFGCFLYKSQYEPYKDQEKENWLDMSICRYCSEDYRGIRLPNGTSGFGWS